ncbi:hypothetical protein C0Q70_12576 [Pomacea canaliculata]|uniref:Uncharacterized protein n=1 Tax=Pomacea canaliculata TaxID=400727 RepID=A0A2T7P1Y0_POMCA|nr:hypothetical protein C0Q70_12576 [Pomacea canaliculata]
MGNGEGLERNHVSERKRKRKRERAGLGGRNVKPQEDGLTDLFYILQVSRTSLGSERSAQICLPPPLHPRRSKAKLLRNVTTPHATSHQSLMYRPGFTQAELSPRSTSA